MATGFSFKVQGLDNLVKVFNQLPKTVQSELANELDVTAKEIRDGAKKSAPVDEARVRNSISSRKVGPLQFETVAQSFYAGYLEFGTKTKVSVPAGLEDVANSLKGPVSGQGNPIDALQGWVKRKGLAGTYGAKSRRRRGNKATKEKQDRQLAFIIWRHIKKFGIKPQPYFFKQMEPAEDRLRKRLAVIIKSLIE
jgi:HK97 gp10 family phage protein